MGVRPLKRRKSMYTDLQLLLDPLALRAKAKVVRSANLLAFTPRPSDPRDLIYMAQALAPCVGKRGGTHILSINC